MVILYIRFLHMNKINTIIVDEILTAVKFLPNDYIDLSITSPPYNKKEKVNKGWLVKEVIYEDTDDCLPEDQYQLQQIDVLNEMHRITKPNGHFFYNHKIRWEQGKMIHPIEWIIKSKWNIRQEIIWNRTIASNIRGWRFWQVEERIYWLQKENGVGKELESKDARLTSIWNIVPESNKKIDHPTPFPLQLPARIILSILKKEGIVFDPYCGSGTSLVAAKLLGHDYLGVEKSQKYVDSALKRLERCNEELHVIEEEKSLHVIEKTYKERKIEGMWDHKIKRKPNPLLEY